MRQQLREVIIMGVISSILAACAGERPSNLRSASRLGYSDLGKNRSRIEEIRTKISNEERKP